MPDWLLPALAIGVLLAFVIGGLDSRFVRRYRGPDDEDETV